MRTLNALVMAALVSGLTMSVGGADAATAPGYAYVAGKYSLELGGAQAGFLWEAGGGAAVADFQTQQKAAGTYPKKNVSAVHYEDITVAVGAGMTRGFYDWIKTTLQNPAGAQRRDGAIVAADYNYKERSRLNFTRAMISNIEFPAADASSKDAAKIHVSISPELTRRLDTTAGGKTLAAADMNASAQKKWVPANFRLKIDGIDPSVTSQVSKIEAINVRFKSVAAAIGERRDFERTPSTVDISNVVLEVTEQHAAPFIKWHEDFAINGNNRDDKERNGTLEYLAPDLRTVLFTLTFSHLGIIKAAPAPSVSLSETVRRVRVEMYVEGLGFDYAQTMK